MRYPALDETSEMRTYRVDIVAEGDLASNLPEGDRWRKLNHALSKRRDATLVAVVVNVPHSFDVLETVVSHSAVQATGKVEFNELVPCPMREKKKWSYGYNQKRKVLRGKKGGCGSSRRRRFSTLEEIDERQEDRPSPEYRIS